MGGEVRSLVTMNRVSYYYMSNHESNYKIVIKAPFSITVDTEGNRWV